MNLYLSKNDVFIPIIFIDDKGNYSLLFVLLLLFYIILLLFVLFMWILLLLFIWILLFSSPLKYFLILPSDVTKPFLEFDSLFFIDISLIYFFLECNISLISSPFSYLFLDSIGYIYFKFAPFIIILVKSNVLFWFDEYLCLFIDYFRLYCWYKLIFIGEDDYY